MLKREVEHHTRTKIKLTIAGGGEAHLLAKELGAAKVGVILNPVRPFPATWESRRILPGPPLTEESQILHLLNHKVTVGVGILEGWQAESTRWDLGWVAVEGWGKISTKEALMLGSVNMIKLLGGSGLDGRSDSDLEFGLEGGLDREFWNGELVATAGGDLLEFGSRVVAVVSAGRGLVDVF